MNPVEREDVSSIGTRELSDITVEANVPAEKYQRNARPPDLRTQEAADNSPPEQSFVCE
jgi:hypothetical protein